MQKLIKSAVAATMAFLPLTPIYAVDDNARDNMPVPVTSGVNHLGLTVSDLDASTKFFTELLGWRPAGGRPNYPANFVTDGKLFLTLWRATDPEKAIPFNRKTNVGLHHLALTVADIETLEEIHQKLKAAPGVKIEFAPEPAGNGPTIHMMTYEPSGNRIEFIVPGGVSRKDKKD